MFNDEAVEILPPLLPTATRLLSSLDDKLLLLDVDIIVSCMR